MSQIKIYASAETIDLHRQSLSDAIHRALVEQLQYPTNKKFQRFIRLNRQDFIYPPDRSASYLIIEISMFSGRSKLTKKALIQSIFNNIQILCGIDPFDVEITIFETPQENWGIRGQNADELMLDYKVDV